MIKLRFVIIEMIVLLTVTASCSIPDYVVPNLVCEIGTWDETGRTTFTFEDPALNKAISDSNIDYQVGGLDLEEFPLHSHRFAVVSQSVLPGKTLSYGSDLEFDAYPINAIKDDWDVPADEPWPTDCQPNTTSNTPLDNTPDALYKASSRSIVKGVVESLASLQELFVSVDPYDQMWVLDVAGELLTFRDAYSEVQKLTPPSSLKIAHETLLSSLKILSDVSYSLPKAFDSGNTNEIGKQAQRMWDSLEGIDSFTAMTN